MKSLLAYILVLCLFFTNTLVTIAQNTPAVVVVGAERMVFVIPTIKNKHIAIVANQTSMVGQTHLVDTLRKVGADIKVIFCPEHGFRGTEGAGERVRSTKDSKTGIPIVSLYGKKLKPSAVDLAGVDMVIYDLQDVGVRFYTYISTLSYVMQACAENFVPLFILDRPDPNGFYIDGPVLEPKFKSFVGMLPIPLVYAMTVGELADMINEEGWLPNNLKCSIGVIPCQNYSHKTRYTLPVNPSPNLQNMKAIYLYPSLGLFEGTVMNVGRGTEFPFQVYGNPHFMDTTFKYTPHKIEGVSTDPPHLNVLCFGEDLRPLNTDSLAASTCINLAYLANAYNNYADKSKFFNSFFENLAGTASLRKQISSKMPEDSIRKSWQPAILKFKAIRKKYLLYEDF